MNSATAGTPRSPLATATAVISSTKPIGSSHSRLNHLLFPMRTRGATPYCAGADPAQEPSTRVFASVESSSRKLTGVPGPVAGTMEREPSGLS